MLLLIFTFFFNLHIFERCNILENIAVINSLFKRQIRATQERSKFMKELQVKFLYYILFLIEVPASVLIAYSLRFSHK